MFYAHVRLFGNVKIKERCSRKLRSIILLQIGLVTFKFHFRKASKIVAYVCFPEKIIIGVAWITNKWIDWFFVLIINVIFC